MFVEYYEVHPGGTVKAKRRRPKTVTRYFVDWAWADGGGWKGIDGRGYATLKRAIGEMRRWIGPGSDVKLRILKVVTSTSVVQGQTRLIGAVRNQRDGTTIQNFYRSNPPRVAKQKTKRKVK